MVEFYPPSPDEEHPYGIDVVMVAGGTLAERYAATAAAIMADFAAEFDAGSGTTLAERALGIDTYADDDDLANGCVDVYTAFLVGDERPVGWPSVAADKALIDVILETRAP